MSICRCAASGPDEYLAKGQALFDEYKAKGEKNPRVTFAMSPHSTYAVSEPDIIRAHKMAKDLGIKFHTHLHETETEVVESMKSGSTSSFSHQSEVDCRPVARLKDLGIMDEDMIAAHMTQVKNYVPKQLQAKYLD